MELRANAVSFCVPPKKTKTKPRKRARPISRKCKIKKRADAEAKKRAKYNYNNADLDLQVGGGRFMYRTSVETPTKRKLARREENLRQKATQRR